MDAYLNSLREIVAPLLPPAVSNAFSLPPPPPPVVPFPHLPVELVFRILSYTLPPPSYTHAKERAKRLKHFALLNKDFARWAVLELRTHVAVSSLDAARWFAMTARKKGTAWAGAVRTLRLGSAEQFVRGPDGQSEAVDRMWRAEGSSQAVRDLLRACGNVEELWVCGISGVEVDHLGAGKNLRKLYVTETRIIPSIPPAADPPSFTLPSLESLYLKSVIFAGSSLASFLAPDALPALRTLDYLSVHQSLVTPAVQPPARPRPQAPGGSVAFFNATGGANSLASMTAALGALTTGATPTAAPGTASAPPAPTVAHPILTLSSQLTSLSLGPHSTRTLPVNLLTNRGFALHFPSLRTLSIPVTLLFNQPLDPSDYPPSLTALRVTRTGVSPPLQELLLSPSPSSSTLADASAAPDFFGEAEHKLALAQRVAGDYAMMEARGLSVLQLGGADGAGADEGEEGRDCVLTVPRLPTAVRSALRPPLPDAGTAPSTDRPGDECQRVLCHSPPGSSPVTSSSTSSSSTSAAGPRGVYVRVVYEDQEMREEDPLWRDGVWELEHERWREGIEGWRAQGEV
ncbi:hypothetical protein JCM8097_000045 [Rhodosporidiobolus ruineniae]